MAIKEALLPKLQKDPRFAAIKILEAVLKGDSLTEALPQHVEPLNESDRRFTQHLVFGTLRNFDELEDRVGQMLQKPIKNSEIEVKLSHYLAAYELTEMATAEYAILNNWVNLIKTMEKPWAAGLTNAILRNIQRGKFPRAKSYAGEMNLPNWFAKRLENQWGVEKLEAISTFYRLHPEMILRVNPQVNSRDQYLKQLQEKGIEAHPHAFVDSALVLDEPTNVENLPGFESGSVTVQDASAQLAALILAPQKGERVLDACAAPGGKTTGILEIAPKLAQLVALDASKERLKRVDENISRIFGGPLANVSVDAIACEAYQLNGDEPFDKILLDVPCSATGIMHRHPDIKRLRKASDIQNLRDLQWIILNHAWGLLKPGGRLLYATCSILKDENEQQIRRFLKAELSAQEVKITLNCGEVRDVGIQILPTYFAKNESMDGFYYALLEKVAD